ncbi:MAG TPA: phage tail tube protein [Cyclobacteriaceae bacterium]|nr:phage tail tube protein [Cyclobacteriaceae bacterium]
MINGQVVAITTECSHSISVASRETTSKDDGGKYQGEPTKVTETLKGSYIVAFDNNAYQTLRALARAKSKFTYRFGSVVSGDPYDQGTGFFTSLDTSAPNNDSVTGSYSIQITGTVTPSTNP